MTQDRATSADACLRAALAAVAGARPHGTPGIIALLLALLARLFAGTDTAWSFSHDDDEWDDCGFDTVALRDTSLHARPIFQPAIGRAPHAIFVERGLVPGYVMAGVRNRGMRASPAPARMAPRAAPARAPPAAHRPIRRIAPPDRGRRRASVFIPISIQIARPGQPDHVSAGAAWRKQTKHAAAPGGIAAKQPPGIFRSSQNGIPPLPRKTSGDAPMFKTFAAAAVIALLAAAPAQAALDSNAITLNGMSINSISTNALTGNALTANGLSVNSISTNALTDNAFTTNALTLNALTQNALTLNALTQNALGSNGIVSNGFSDNAIIPNALTSNALFPNALTQNALAGNGLGSNGMVNNGVKENSVSPTAVRRPDAAQTLRVIAVELPAAR